jgi:hypothetical protein
LYLISALKVIWATSVVLFKYYFVLLPSSQRFRVLFVVIVIFCKFYNIRFSCCVKGVYPGTPDFSLAAQMRMRYQASNHGHALRSGKFGWQFAEVENP